MNLRHVTISRLVVLAGVLLFSHSALAQQDAATPATQPAGRTGPVIFADIQKTGQELRTVITGPEVFTDDTKRAEAAPKAVPVLKRMLALTDEMSALSDAQAKEQAKGLRSQFQFMLALLDDKDATAGLEQQSASPVKSDAVQAKCMLLTARWMHSGKDAAAQGKVLDEMESLSKSEPTSDDINMALQQISHTTPADPALGKRAEALVASFQSSRPPKNLENKPLVISGTRSDGTTFSTDNWKGKVILVDFWATWCPPCLAELPRVKKAYADFHEKGLEILGVSNDQTADALTSFVAKDPGMPWPQLFDAKAAAKGDWNPITTGYGIDGIPTMFLIDRKGICRTVDARENFEQMIPKLLDEPAK